MNGRRFRVKPSTVIEVACTVLLLTFTDAWEETGQLLEALQAAGRIVLLYLVLAVVVLLVKLAIAEPYSEGQEHRG